MRRRRRARRLAAKRWGAASYYGDLAELLADDSVDAVEILTPTHLHHAHVKAALEAGKHVSVQKPITNSVDEALELGAVADTPGRTLRVSECFVHYPPLEMAKSSSPTGPSARPSACASGPWSARPTRTSRPPCAPRATAGASTSAAAGGHLFDDNVHKYAMALWLVDPDIISVQAVVRRRDLFFEPCAVIFEYDDPELLGTMEVQYAPRHVDALGYFGADEFFEVQGDEGFSSG